jgi:sugar O-acyltransferase (sialic acid O-acetyltransferase NeuD family)
MKRKAIIVGAGGHCRVIISLLAMVGDTDVLGIIDLSEFRAEENIMGLAVLGSSAILEKFYGRRDLDLYLAIGENKLRYSWWLKLRDAGFSMPNLFSPLAIIDPTAHLGEANVVCARAFIGPKVVMGSNNLINTAAILEHEVYVGSHCHFAPASTVAGRSEINDGCFICAGSTVIDNIKIAENVTIGAGATLIHNATEPGALYIGIPAKLKRERHN